MQCSHTPTEFLVNHRRFLSDSHLAMKDTPRVANEILNMYFLLFILDHGHDLKK